MNNNELIQQARELCEKATPGPWKSKETADYSEIYGNHSWGKALRPLAMVGSNLDDSAFIAASRALVPQLCEALEAAEKELIDCHHTQQVADGKTAENARMRKINEQVAARAEKAEAQNRWIPVSERPPDVWSHDGGEPIEFNVMLPGASVATTMCFDGSQ